MAIDLARKTETPLPRRGSENQVLGTSGKPLLVIVEGSDVDAMVAAGLNAIGGIGRLLGADRTVLLKPNTNQRDPFPSTTDPATIRAVARQCVEAGARQVALHEDHKAELDFYYQPAELPGIDIQLSHAPTAEHFVLVEHDKWGGDRDIPSAEEAGAMSRMLTSLAGYQPDPEPHLRVARQIQEASLVINMPVLKRHFHGQITSALKNHFGAVYGPHRWLAHVSIERNRDYYDRKLAEFASAVRPELTITDVRSLQAGFGPWRNDDTYIVEGVNRMIFTGDMVAADTVALSLMKQHDPTFQPESEAIIKRQHRYAEDLGLGTTDLSRLEVLEITA